MRGAHLPKCLLPFRSVHGFAKYCNTLELRGPRKSKRELKVGRVPQFWTPWSHQFSSSPNVSRDRGTDDKSYQRATGETFPSLRVSKKKSNIFILKERGGNCLEVWFRFRSPLDSVVAHCCYAEFHATAALNSGEGIWLTLVTYIVR